MTFYEALVPVCLQMFAEGKITLDDKMDWGFKYIDSTNAVEEMALSLSDELREPPNYWEGFCVETRKAAKIISNFPLMQALS